MANPQNPQNPGGKPETPPGQDPDFVPPGQAKPKPGDPRPNQDLPKDQPHPDQTLPGDLEQDDDNDQYTTGSRK